MIGCECAPPPPLEVDVTVSCVAVGVLIDGVDGAADEVCAKPDAGSAAVIAGFRYSVLNVCVWKGICGEVNVVEPVVTDSEELTEPCHEREDIHDEKTKEPPTETLPDTTRNAWSSYVVIFVQPVGAEVWLNMVIVPVTKSTI